MGMGRSGLTWPCSVIHGRGRCPLGDPPARHPESMVVGTGELRQRPLIEVVRKSLSVGGDLPVRGRPGPTNLTLDLAVTGCQSLPLLSCVARRHRYNAPSTAREDSPSNSAISAAVKSFISRVTIALVRWSRRSSSPMTCIWPTTSVSGSMASPSHPASSLRRPCS